MKKISTLIYLVNQTDHEFPASHFAHFPEGKAENDHTGSFDGFAPPDHLVKRILRYARSLEVVSTRSAGKVEWVLN